MTLGLHAPWRGQTIAHPHAPLAEAALEVLRTCQRFGERAGAAYLVVHADARSYAGYPVDSVRDRAFEHVRDGLARLVDRTETVEIVVENTTGHPTETPGGVRRVLDAVPGLGFCYDPGHAMLAAYAEIPDASGEADAWFDTLGGRLTLLHLMDVARTGSGPVDHLLPGDGDLDLRALVDAASGHGLDRVVVEAFATREGAEATPKAIRESLRQAGFGPS